MELKVKQITQKDEAFFEVTKWMKDWWKEEEGLTFDETEAIMDRSLNEEGYPKTYALTRGEEVVGVFQLTLFDLHVTPDLYPWLANVYVKKEERGKGYSRLLLNEAVRIAREDGIKRLWLFTSHEGLYEKYGFTLDRLVDTFTKTPRIQRLYFQDL